MDSNQRLRARIVLGGICIAAIVLVVVLYKIQVINGSSYADRAHRQYTQTSRGSYDRGSIFFSAKDGTRPSAATMTSSYVLYMNPTNLVDPLSAYETLSHYMDIDKEDFMAKASLANDPYEEIAKDVSVDIAESISELSLDGIGTIMKRHRTYPGGHLASHTLGIIGDRDGEVAGRYGLERIYENILKRNTLYTERNAFSGLFGSSTSQSEVDVPGDIVTTIEPTVQAYVEKVITKTVSQWKPDEMGVIIMDPRSGDIIAMGASPDFDPNDTSNIRNVGVLSNPLVENSYEMGSIMKPLTVAIGLDSGAINSTWTYDDTGTMTLSGKTIANFDGKARGRSTAQTILNESLNVGAASIALEVGKQEFVKYMSSLGFGDKTGIDQPNETAGLTSNLKTGRDIEIATMAYGQGIALSPIAITRALGVLANKGILIRPRVVKEIQYVDGTKDIIEPQKGVVVLNEKNIETVTTMLVKVVDTALRHGSLKMERYSIAAKTGTAQIPDPVSKGYYSDRYLHSFFGYFPAYEPRFIVFLYQKYPKGAQYASETLVDPFGELTTFLIEYYGISPDR